MVALIVLSVLLTPARFFHDQPVYRPTLSSDSVRLGAGADGVR